MLAVLQDFLNTRDERSFTVHGTRHPGGDELATPAALTSWLVRRGLIHAGTRASDADLGQAHALREALRGALAARAGSEAGTGWPLPNGTLAVLSLRIELGADGTPRLSPVAGGAVPAALTRLAASAAAAAADGSWQRSSRAPRRTAGGCSTTTSRNGVGRWCSMRVSGNGGKTRAYRQRQRHSPSLPGKPPNIVTATRGVGSAFLLGFEQV